jgi:hypothetical protein
LEDDSKEQWFLLKELYVTKQSQDREVNRPTPGGTTQTYLQLLVAKEEER